jgi:DNA topoisomerase-1
VGIPKGVGAEDIGLSYALLLLSLPRSLGTDPATGKEVTVGIGRYGPYVHRDGTYRNLKAPDKLFEIELPEALALLETQQGREILKELGPHPESGANLQVLDGRYGPYVTDGSVNASLPKGSDPETLAMDEAVDLLAKAKARKGKRSGRGRGSRKGKRGGGSRGSK